MTIDIDRPKERKIFSGTVRSMKMEDLTSIKPILETWIIDRDTGKSIPKEVEEDLDLMKQSMEGTNERIYLIAETLQGEVIGVIGLKKPDEVILGFTKTKHPLELVNAYVAEEHRNGKGVGTALVNELEVKVKSMGCAEIILNSGPRYRNTAWGFYDRLRGYERVGVAENYYGEDGDAPVWSKIL